MLHEQLRVIQNGIIDGDVGVILMMLLKGGGIEIEGEMGIGMVNDDGIVRVEGREGGDMYVFLSILILSPKIRRCRDN
jgi:hypothetical protein